MIDNYKEISKEYARKLTGELLYQSQQKSKFEKTDAYKITLLKNYINSLGI